MGASGQAILSHGAISEAAAKPSREFHGPRRPDTDGPAALGARGAQSRADERPAIRSARHRHVANPLPTRSGSRSTTPPRQRSPSPRFRAARRLAGRPMTVESPLTLFLAALAAPWSFRRRYGRNGHQRRARIHPFGHLHRQRRGHRRRRQHDEPHRFHHRLSGGRIGRRLADRGRVAPTSSAAGTLDGERAAPQPCPAFTAAGAPPRSQGSSPSHVHRHNGLPSSSPSPTTVGLSFEEAEHGNDHRHK